MRRTQAFTSVYRNSYAQKKKNLVSIWSIAYRWPNVYRNSSICCKAVLWFQQRYTV